MSRKFKFNSKKKKTLNLLGSKSEIFDVNQISESHIELFFNREIIINGCLGVFEYREDYIKLNLKKGEIILCGRDFYIASFEDSEIVIFGNISSIEFCCLR